MKKIFFFFCIFGFLANAGTNSKLFENGNPQQENNYYLFNILTDLDSSVYYKLLDSVKNGLSTDYFRLRMAYTKTGEYNPYDTETARNYKEIETAIAAGNFDSALEISEKIIEKNFVDPTAHVYAGYCYQMKGNAAKSDYHNEIYSEIMDSIYKTGDGRSPESAFLSISTKEEYIFLNWLNLAFVEQELVNKDGYSFDLMKCKDQTTGKNFNIYFNISPAMDFLTNSAD